MARKTTEEVIRECEIKLMEANWRAMKAGDAAAVARLSAAIAALNVKP